MQKFFLLNENAKKIFQSKKVKNIKFDKIISRLLFKVLLNVISLA